MLGCGAGASSPGASALPTPAATVAAAGTASSAAELSPALAPLAWWLGSWDADDGTSTEHWIAAAGAIYGVSLDAEGGFEILIIDDGKGRGKADGVVRMFAMPGGEPAVEFVQRTQDAQAASFGNDEHDFPKQVSYRRDGEALAAEISGSDKVIPFRFHRAAAPSAPPLEAADLAFAADTAKRGVEGWVSAFEPEGWTLAAGKKANLAEIRADMTPFLAEVHIAWAPVASGSRGDLGFTIGKATFTKVADHASWRGTYVTIWHRQPDGSWKVRFDTGRPVHDEA
jgi:hypothetical protein